jgi:hypothetical protein
MGLFSRRQSGVGTIIGVTDMYGVWYEMILEMESGERERVKVSRKEGGLITVGDIVSLNYQPGKKNGKAKNIEIR